MGDANAAAAISRLNNTRTDSSRVDAGRLTLRPLPGGTYLSRLQNPSSKLLAVGRGLALALGVSQRATVRRTFLAGPPSRRNCRDRWRTTSFRCRSLDFRSRRLFTGSDLRSRALAGLKPGPEGPSLGSSSLGWRRGCSGLQL